MIGARGIAETLGVTRHAVNKWRIRFADFPEPIGVGPWGDKLWRWSEVAEWAEAHGRYDGVAEVSYCRPNGPGPQPFCQKGLHEMEDENVYTSPKGERLCKPCRSVTQRTWERANRDRVRDTSARYRARRKARGL